MKTFRETPGRVTLFLNLNVAPVYPMLFSNLLARAQCHNDIGKSAAWHKPWGPLVNVDRGKGIRLDDISARVMKLHQLPSERRRCPQSASPTSIARGASECS